MALIVKVVIEEENIKKFEGLQYSSSEDQFIYEKLHVAIDKLKVNPYRGRNIRKKLIPDKYKKFKNLWRDKLSDDWRLLYSVVNTGDNIIAVIIVDWMPHKEYNKIFGYGENVLNEFYIAIKWGLCAPDSTVPGHRKNV